MMGTTLPSPCIVAQTELKICELAFIALYDERKEIGAGKQFINILIN